MLVFGGLVTPSWRCMVQADRLFFSLRCIDLLIAWNRSSTGSFVRDFSISVLAVFSASLFAQAAPLTSASSPETAPADFVAGLHLRTALAHEQLPIGVPASYDWYRTGKSDRGNEVPVGFTAFTGWGQAFWGLDSNDANADLEIRDLQSWVCSCDTGAWARIQASVATGAQFRADFAGNISSPPARMIVSGNGGVISVRFARGSAFHFWPSEGRIAIGSARLCGTRVLARARLVPTSADEPLPAVLLGFGADYWLDVSAPWRNYQTNSAAGVGQLRLVGANWKWFGFATLPVSRCAPTLLR